MAGRIDGLGLAPTPGLDNGSTEAGNLSRKGSSSSAAKEEVGDKGGKCQLLAAGMQFVLASFRLFPRR